MCHLGVVCVCRDIKPENILFDESILKVADFGLALNTNEEHAVTRAGEKFHKFHNWMGLLAAPSII